MCCGPDTNIGAAVEMLRVHNCGMLPVVDGNKGLVGIVTDRDICVALGTRNKLAGDLSVGQVATTPVFTWKPDDEIHEALGVMSDHQVRRFNDEGVPQGVLSMDDILLHADQNKWEGCCELASEEINRCLKKMHAQQFLIVHSKAMAG